MVGRGVPATLETGASRLRTSSGRALTLHRLIGEGSQGAVYEASDDKGSRSAVKLYYASTGGDAQRQLIEDLIDRGAPDARFLWPQETLESDDGRFGYVMSLRPDTYAGLADLLTGRADATFATACRLCIELADAFLKLHSNGLCYRDISFGNVFFEPSSGAILICDNDNVGIDGASRSGVLGTRRFMAPEIVRRESLPSAATDLYSLSVLLFYVLMMGHPLLGRRELDFACWDDRAESELFGREPVFVFDPTDRSNEPAPSVHDAVLQYWDLYPGYVREQFVQAFTQGLVDPYARVRESVWRTTLSRLRDGIVKCTRCNREGFVERGVATASCWSCRSQLSEPNWLVLGRRAVAVSEGAHLHGHHLNGDYDYATTIAEVVRHPTNPDLLGLRNLTEGLWTARLPGGDEREVEPGRSVRVTPGVEVDLGRVVARVEDHGPIAGS